jgi:hypothetical protein
MAEGRVRGFSIATKCATVEELVEKFRDRVDADSILVSTVESREIGTECSFAILLADKKVGLAGTCIVREVFTDANNPFQRPGMQLAIKRLGPESQRVFQQLQAKRIAPRRMTQSLPIISRTSTQRPSTESIPPVGSVIPTQRAGKKTEAPRTKASDVVVPRTASSTFSRSGVPAVVVQRATQPMRGLREAPQLEVVPEPRRIPTLQIPPIEAVDEPLARAPRATPFHLELVPPRVEEEPEPITAVGAPPPAEVKAEAQPVVKPAVDAKARVETRTPGSPIILPANPFTELTDASLEGFVDCRLFEAKGALAESPKLALGPAQLAALASDGVVRKILEAPPSEPMALPPPPVRAAEAPVRPTPLTYAETKLPDLPVPNANDRVSQPLITRRMRNRILMAVLLVPVLGAVAVVGFMKLTASPLPTTAVVAPPTVATIEVSTSATATMEPAPPVPPQKIHAVLIKTFPIAAKVTVGNRSFGTTPTYIKIPANTPVRVRMERPGFRVVNYPLTSRSPIDRVFVRLERRGRR